MARAINSDVQTDGDDTTVRPWARAWISSSYMNKEVTQTWTLLKAQNSASYTKYFMNQKLEHLTGTVVLIISLSWSDPPVCEASDGGLRAPASSVCTQAPWLSAAPAVASWYSPLRLSEWCPYSSACLWGIQETKIYSQSQLTSWPEKHRILYGPSEQIITALKLNGHLDTWRGRSM